MPQLNNSYKILEKENLIIEYFSGILTIETLIKFKKNLIQDPIFSVNYNYLLYFKNVTFKIDVEDISEYVIFSNNYLKTNKNRKVAMVTDNPNQVALATLFKIQKSKHEMQKIELFSTTKNAIHWLGFDISILDKVDFMNKWD
jgi:hypothetical protein